MAQGQELADALALESIEYSKSIQDSAAEAEAEVKVAERAFAAKGLLQSGIRYVRELEIRFDKMANGVIGRAIAKRKELGRRVPELLDQNHLNDLRIKLHDFADAMVRGQQSRVDMSGSAMRDASIALNRQAESKASGLKARITQDLEALRLEARLGIYEQDKQVTFNISNNTIANLNLGAVVGDLVASVQVLTSQGQPEFAKAVQTLTEALALSTEVQADRKKELLEHLSLISSEVGHPAEKRKMGLVKSSIAFLREGLSNVAQLAGLWETTEKILKTLGFLN